MRLMEEDLGKRSPSTKVGLEQPRACPSPSPRKELLEPGLWPLARPRAQSGRCSLQTERLAISWGPSLGCLEMCAVHTAATKLPPPPVEVTGCRWPGTSGPDGWGPDGGRYREGLLLALGEVAGREGGEGKGWSEGGRKGRASRIPCRNQG